MALNDDNTSTMIAQMARLEERMDNVTQKIEGTATHQEKMWGRIDEVVSGLVELKTIFKMQSLEPGTIKDIVNKLDSFNSRLITLEVKSHSAWEAVKPFVYSIMSGAGALVLAKVVGFIPK